MKKKVQVLYLTMDGLLDPLGQSQVLPYIKDMVNSRYEWTLMSFEKIKDPKIIYECKNELQKLGIKWFWFSYHKHFFLKMVYLTYGILFIFCHRKKYQLIHARSYVSAILGLFLKYGSAVKLIFDMRGFFPDERVEGGTWKKNGLWFKIFKFLERKLLKHSDYVIVLTQKAKTILETEYSFSHKPIEVIPTCVDTRFFRGEDGFKDNNHLLFFYIGSLGTWYGSKEMLSFILFLREQGMSSTLRLLINKSSKNFLDPLFFRKDYSEIVEIQSCGYKELPALLRQASWGIYFIYPSPSKRASCPTKLAEFLAMGIPVVTNRGIGDCDVWIEGERLGVLVDDFSDASYEKALKELKLLLNDSSIRKRCVTFARQHLSLEEGVARYKKVYASLLGNG